MPVAPRADRDSARRRARCSSPTYGLALLSLALLIGCRAEPASAPVCDAGATQMCFCAEGGASAQVCLADGSRWGVCSCRGEGSTGEENPTTSSGNDDDAELGTTSSTGSGGPLDSETEPGSSSSGGGPLFSCDIGGVCDVPLARNPSLVLEPIPASDPRLEFGQAITTDRWGTIHLFWETGGTWHEKSIEHLPNASEQGGRQWQYVRGVDYVCPSDGPVPRDWIDCGTSGCRVPPIGEMVYYVVVDNDGVAGQYTMRTEATPYVWDFERDGCAG